MVLVMPHAMYMNATYTYSQGEPSGIPGLVNRSAKITAFEHAPIIIHGRYLPIRILVLSTIVPIIGSLMPSQIRAIGVKISKNAAGISSTSVKYFAR